MRGAGPQRDYTVPRQERQGHPQGEGGGGWRLHRQPVHHSAAVPALQQAGDTQRSVTLSGMKLPMLYYYIHTYPHTRTHTMPSVVVDGVEWREVTSVRMVATVGHCHLSTKKAKYLNIAKESTYPTVCSVGKRNLKWSGSL